MEIEQEVLKNCKLSKLEAEEIKIQIDDFLKELQKRLKNVNAIAVLGGSAAKGTLLRGDFDCDIFVRFSPEYDDISGLLKKSLKGLKFETVHGSRDYFRIKNTINFEIVPVLMVDDAKSAKNVTDMSPMHVEWIKKKLNSRLADQIIIAKKFCKSQGCYGAESYIGGFSGHVLDILIVYYGSFKNLLNCAKDWKSREIIDVEDYRTAGELNKSKLSPLLVIDPVDKHRNAAAALSYEKFNLFRKRAKEYLESPDFAYFEKKEFKISDIKKNAGANTLIVHTARPLKGKNDVVGGKLMKVYDHIKRQLELNDFEVIDSGWNWDKAATYWYILKPEILTDKKMRMGPPLSDQKSTEKFRSKHPNFIIKDNRLYAEVKREYRNPKKLVKDLISSKYVKERTAQ